MLDDKYYIFDLDGTLTCLKGEMPDVLSVKYCALSDDVYDILVSDKDLHARIMSAWSEEKKTNQDKIGVAINFNNQILRIIPEDKKNDDAIFNAAVEAASLYMEHGVIRMEAISFLVQALEKGNKCIISTASFEAAARGFIHALVIKNIIPEDLEKNIICIGTKIDWKAVEIIHYNSAQGKITGLESFFSLDIETIAEAVDFAIGDEPNSGDYELLSIMTPNF